jgi:transposase
VLRKIGVIKKRPLVNPNGRPKKDLDIYKILQMKCDGLSNCEIGRKFGVSEGTIRNRLKKHEDGSLEAKK